ncbi:MAG: GtrA family protein [Hyphomicrobiales bacterium]|nr:GtrA family protein [Hyphomicrobiales bacterium]MCA1999866.1 GtrA family protein [Hyphomicrobiales bacterium]
MGAGTGDMSPDEGGAGAGMPGGVLARAGRLARQFRAFFGVGIVAAIVHYGLLVLLVEAFFYDSASAAGAGYLAGGAVSYMLNRAFTYDAARGHLDALWRFAIVALLGAGLTWLLMWLMTRGLGWHYLLLQGITTGIVLVWSFFAHKYWSFRDRA